MAKNISRCWRLFFLSTITYSPGLSYILHSPSRPTFSPTSSTLITKKPRKAPYTPSSLCVSNVEIRSDDGDLASRSARALLYEDVQNSRARAAEHEGELLKDRISPLEAPFETTLEGAGTAKAPPKMKQPKTARSSGGVGFGGGGGGASVANIKKGASPASKKEKKPYKKKKKKYEDMTVKEKQTLHQAAALRRDGCLRVDSALKKTTATRLKACILQEIHNAKLLKEEYPEKIDEINAEHGIDQERTGRCVINLPLRADTIQNFRSACADADPTFSENESESIGDALEELLDREKGALGPLIAELCGDKALLYEFCSLVTWPGSLRQSVHPDAAYQPNPPLFAAFVATQDITREMGPTLFLPGTHMPSPIRAQFDREETRQDMIAEYPTPKEALLKAGDMAIFDMRCLHVGQANKSKLSSRVLFNLTFRNPAADQPIGYDGSIRNHYFEKFTLDGMQTELERGREHGDAFASVG